MKVIYHLHDSLNAHKTLSQLFRAQYYLIGLKILPFFQLFNPIALFLQGLRLFQPQVSQHLSETQAHSTSHTTIIVDD